MTFIERIDDIGKKPFRLALVLIALSATFRFPTLFNDYYDADELAAIVQTREYLAGGIPGVDFSESKLPLYHAIFKISYRLWPEKGWVIVHALTIIAVWLTSVGIYFAGKSIRSPAVGTISACMYAIFISSFNRHFMATNGEIIFNLPVAWGFYFFILYLKKKNASRGLFLLCAAFMVLAASYVKFHGLILGIYLAFFFLVYRPWWEHKITKKYFISAIAIGSVCIIAFLIDYFTTNIFAHAIVRNVYDKLYYATAKGLNPLVFLAKYVHRQGLLILWHFAAWFPAMALTVRFIKNKCRFDTIEESATLVFFGLSYLLIFAGLARLYHHYFMASYPALALTAALALEKPMENVTSKIRARLLWGFAIPSFFFLLWNTKDIIIKHYFPSAFYHEPKAIYWARAALIGHFQDYLLPELSYLNAIHFIKENTQEGDRIFVWGDGPYLYYFSNRRMGIQHLWPKTTIIRLHELYKKSDAQSLAQAHHIERSFIATIERKKPVLFIDTSENGLTGFVYPVTPLIDEYVQKNYTHIGSVDKMKFYIIKERKIYKF
ncbi:MAG: hypothetical protein N2316_00050 [Spirochaetes bacterium]|nr:hypothetical protein [Spirochaetota bacterium]